jgi:hypothetical protein
MATTRADMRQPGTMERIFGGTGRGASMGGMMGGMGGEERLKPGQLRFAKGVRYGLYHGRPRDLWINVALCWKVPKSRAQRNLRRGKKGPEEPW